MRATGEEDAFVIIEMGKGKWKKRMRNDERWK
jgi:hypothetical protein